MARRKSDPTGGGAVPPESEETGAGSPPDLPKDDASVEPPADAAPSAPTDVPPASPDDAAPASPIEDAADRVHDPAAPYDEPHEEIPEEHHEEYAGPSFAARALTVLLLLIVGAALGIWGAPKLAPMLPAGLAPVAEWLSPGQRAAEARVAELDARLQTAMSDLESRLLARVAEVPTAADIDSRITAAAGEVETRLQQQIASLQDTLAELDGAQTRQRLSRAESSIDGQAAELAAIKDQISGGAEAAGAQSAETAEQVDLYRAEVEGLRAEMGALSDGVAALSSRIDDVAAEADREIETARAEADEAEAQAATAIDSAATEADLAQIRASLAAGLPFADAAERLAAQPDLGMPEPLLAAAQDGVMSVPALRDAFPDAAHEAIRASIMAGAGDGVLARSRAFLEAQVASRSLTPREGAETDAVLSRMEDRLRQDDLAGALEEAGALPAEAAVAMSGWIDAARRRLEAEAAFATLESSLATTTN
jgi:hypothetical protein